MNLSKASSKFSDAKTQKLRRHKLQIQKELKLTQKQQARLLYEIVTHQAISPEASEKMEILLTRDLDPQAWRDSASSYWQFNPVQGFLGEGLPKKIHFVSKAGWTATRRTEVAFVQFPDGATRYILAVFGEDLAYANQGGLFP